MGAFQLLFDLRVEHEYFADGATMQTDIDAGTDTRRRMTQFGMLVQPTTSGIMVLADSARLPMLREQIEQTGEALRLSFHLHSQDPHFAAYTLPVPREGYVPVFDSRLAYSNDGTHQLLHPGACISEDAYVARDGIEPDARHKPMSLRPSVAIVHMVLGNQIGGLCHADCAPAQRHFCLRFGAGHTYWKYLLFGDLRTRQASVVDLDNSVGFRRLDDVVFGPARSAAVYLSDRTIALRAIPPQCMQLREQASFGEKILIRRMPNARVGHCQRELVDGQAVLVSEIFIH